MQGIYGKFFSQQVIAPPSRSILSAKSALILTLP
jgi:hypothetical protein